MKKQIEAKELLDRAEKHLATTVFKWKPDYVMAAPLFDQAAMCFKVGGFFRDAKDCYIKSSESNERFGADAACDSALNCLAKAILCATRVSSASVDLGLVAAGTDSGLAPNCSGLYCWNVSLKRLSADRNIPGMFLYDAALLLFGAISL